MYFFKGKEDLGLQASLGLLDLSTHATIDDANQAYTTLHRMIDLFHRDNEAENNDRKEDLELLACAYEKAVSYLSDQDGSLAPGQPAETVVAIADDDRPGADLHFTINFSNSEDGQSPAGDTPSLPETETDTVENAIAIIARRLKEAETALEDAQEAVDAAGKAVAAANQRLENTRQARMKVMMDAKAAESRAMLMEIEARRATEEAIAIAETVRDRVNAAKLAAKEAQKEADTAQDKIRQVTGVEETAAAEAVCAEDRLEKAKQRLKLLAHAIVEARSQLRMFSEYNKQSRSLPGPAEHEHSETLPAGPPLPHGGESPVDGRQQILSDLMEIENSLTVRKRQAVSSPPHRSHKTTRPETNGERRQHERITYPDSQRPMFSFEGRTIPVRDLSQTGMGIDADDEVGQANLVRGAIVFSGLPTMNVTGRVVRQDDQGLGLRLVTRIGNRILDQERMRLGA